MNGCWRDVEKRVGLKPMGEYFDQKFPLFPGAGGDLKLDLGFIRENRALFGFSDELLAAIERAAARIGRDADLRFAAQFLYWALYEAEPLFRVPYPPNFYPEKMGEDEGLFPMCVLLMNAPRAVCEIVSRKLDFEDVTGNFKSLNEFAVSHFKREGRWGLDNVGWNALCVTEYLSSAGTLRFAPTPVSGCTLYVDERGRYLCLAEEGVEISADGLITEDENPAFMTSVEHSGGGVYAHEVTPFGRVRSVKSYFDLSKYTAVLSPGDDVLGFHIPAGSPYTPENCAKSFEQALALFDEHFPDLNIKGFSCGSWLFSPQLEEIYDGAPSNILNVQRRVFMTPAWPDKSAFHVFVFNTDERTKTEDLPRNTSLQTKIYNYMMSGKTPSVGEMLMPRDRISDLYTNWKEAYV